MNNRLYYAIAGEGLGHATRAHAVIESLEGWDIDLYTFADAYSYFSQHIKQDQSLNRVRLHKIPGLTFGRDAKSKITAWRCGKSFFEYYTGPHQNAVKQIQKDIVEFQPRLVVTDFEPAIAEAGRITGTPVVSIDNQHKFSHFSTGDLPLELRIYCTAMGLLTDWFVGKIDDCVVSTFYAELGKTDNRVIKTQGFIRRRMRELVPTRGDYILVYWKSSVGDEILDALRDCNRPVKVYGRPESRVGYDQFSFHSLNYENFANDLAGCYALFCTSGNQLLGEACHFGKATFTVPESNQHEQWVNAYYAAKMGFAEYHHSGEFGHSDVMEFLEHFVPAAPCPSNGVECALKVIERYCS
jgi:uncharacterized protein (TIGR00661 family)